MSWVEGGTNVYCRGMRVFGDLGWSHCVLWLIRVEALRDRRVVNGTQRAMRIVVSKVLDCVLLDVATSLLES